MNLDLIYVVIGIAASLLTSVVKQEKWDNRTKQTVSVALSFVGGLVGVYLNEKGLTATGVLGAWAATQGISQVVFSYVLRETKLDKILTAIGSKKG